MQTLQPQPNQYRIKPSRWCLLIVYCFLFSSVSGYAGQRVDSPAAHVRNNAKALTQGIVTLIENNQWDAADSLLEEQGETSNETFRKLAEILRQYRELQKSRAEKQEQIFQERHDKLSIVFDQIAENDPNLNYQNAFAQLHNVWKDAADSQKEELKSRREFKTLMQYARRQADEYYAKGQWSRAYAAGISRLMTFDRRHPDSLAWNSKINEVRTILGFLKEDPCEDRHQRYASVRHSTVEKIFSILRRHYVEPLDYKKMAAGMLNRCLVFSDFLEAPSTDLVIHIDPNNVPRWRGHLKQWREDFSDEKADTLDKQGFEDLLDALLALNEKTLKMPEGFLLSMMTDAALSELDSYTDVVWPFAVKDFDKQMRGQFAGVGIHIRKEQGGLRVRSLIPDTPAMKAGLEADTLIVAVDGESIKNMSALCAVRKISGPVGTPVTLTIRYPDSETEEFITIVRDNIVVPAVEGSRQASTNQKAGQTEAKTDGKTSPKTIKQPQGHWDYWLDEEYRIGYLRLKHFTEQALPELQRALEKMETRGLAGLILDVRGNGGGLLTTAVQVADLFIDSGILLHAKGRENKVAVWAATADDVPRTYPLVVLMDGASASASEILAGILRTRFPDRVILAGQRSYGKGSVQEVVDLGNGRGKLKYTAAYYYLPDGTPVKNRDTRFDAGSEDWGIAPDITVPLYDFERRQIRRLNARRAKVSNAVSNEQKQQAESIRREILTADPQMATAVLVLKAKIVAEQSMRQSER